jgi:hypothetical protein
MSQPATVSGTPAPQVTWAERVKPFLAPYYLVLAAFLGLITVVFSVVVILLLIVALNFNVLGWIE